MVEATTTVTAKSDFELAPYKYRSSDIGLVFSRMPSAVRNLAFVINQLREPTESERYRKTQDKFCIFNLNRSERKL